MSKIIDLKDNNYEKLKEIANIIKEGGIAIFPTETVYGIGVDGLNEDAIKKLYEVKKRSFDKPISLLVSNLGMIEKVTKDITDVEYRIMKKFFPGPLTIILKKKDIVPDILTSGGDSVGIRMPDNEIARKLIELVGNPIATTSANISGNISGTNIESILEDFKENVDCFIDNGDSEIGISSTVIKVVDNVPVILREGTIKEEKIEKAICNKNDI